MLKPSDLTKAELLQVVEMLAFGALTTQNSPLLIRSCKNSKSVCKIWLSLR
mgnify:CR=1 FL=1